MNRKLDGIAIILTSILLMIGFGGAHFFDLDFDWSAVFTLTGIIGFIITLLPDKKEK